MRAVTTGALAAYTRVGNVITANANGALAAIDGVTLVVNDRLLLNNGAAGADNGLYVVTQVGTGGTPFILTRATDADTSAEVPPGLAVVVTEGTANGDTVWILTTNGPITLNTTALTFGELPTPNALLAGTGLTRTGQTINAVANADGTIVANADDLQVGTLVAGNVPSGLITSTMIADGTIVNADINAAAAIARSKLDFGSGLVNADIAAAAAIAYSKLALTGAILNADINAAAAIAYSKLALTGAVVNADIANAAAIAYSKLALTNSLVNADIASAAAIAYSKLALSNSIVNADINSAAAIAYSKLNLATSIVHGDVAAANKDGAAATPSMRTLGTGSTQAAPGNAPQPHSGGADATTDLGSPFANQTSFTDTGHSLSFTPTGSIAIVHAAIGGTIATNQTTVQVVVGATGYVMGIFTSTGNTDARARTVRVTGLTPGSPVTIKIQYKNTSTGTFYCRALTQTPNEFASILAWDAQ